MGLAFITTWNFIFRKSSHIFLKWRGFLLLCENIFFLCILMSTWWFISLVGFHLYVCSHFCCFWCWNCFSLSMGNEFRCIRGIHNFKSFLIITSSFGVSSCTHQFSKKIILPFFLNDFQIIFYGKNFWNIFFKIHEMLFISDSRMLFINSSLFVAEDSASSGCSTKDSCSGFLASWSCAEGINCSLVAITIGTTFSSWFS